MSIASRITAITGHITDIYDTMALGGDTTQNKNIVNINTEIKREYKDFLAHGTDELWNNWEKVEGEGETLTLNNTMEGKMKVDLKGNTYQYSTTGKNLANIYNIPNIVVTAFKRKVENDTITIWDNTNTSGYSITERKLSQICPNLQVGDSVKLTFTTTYQTKYIYLSGKNITWSSGSTKTIDQDMLDSIVAFYGGYQTTTVISEFMIRLSSITDNTYEPYTGNQPSPSPDYPQDIQVVSGDNTIRVANGDNTEYEEYPISLGNIELCKIGTYQDKIYKDNGKWYLHKEIGKVVLDGSEGWYHNQYVTGSNVYGYEMLTALNNILLKNTTPVGYICDNFTCVPASEYNTNNEHLVQMNVKTLLFTINRATASTLENFKTWLSNNNTTVYYVLATPTYEEITDTTLLSQLEALAYSYEGTTNISQVNDDMPFVLDITALKEI